MSAWLGVGAVFAVLYGFWTVTNWVFNLIDDAQAELAQRAGKPTKETERSVPR